MLVTLFRRVIHGQRLLRDLFAFSMHSNAMWLLPVVLLLLGFVVLAATSQVVAPYVVYTFF